MRRRTALGEKYFRKFAYTHWFATASMTDVLHRPQLWNKQTSEISSIRPKRDSGFRVVPKRESMLLPDQGHKRGWIRRQAEKDVEAAEGDGWRSEAYVTFSLRLVSRPPMEHPDA